MEDILKLGPSDDNIDKIRKFLNKTSTNDEEHALVVCHLLYLYSLAKQIDFMTYVVDSYTQKYEASNSIIVLDKLIELTVDDFKEVCLSAIEQKKDLLNSYDTDIYYKDMILYHKDNLFERIKYVNLFLEDDTTKENRLSGLFLLAKSYFEFNQFYKFDTHLETTKELALELGSYEIFESILFYEATYFFQVEEYEKSLKVLGENHVKSDYFGSKINLLIFKIYFKQQMYRKCSTFEGENQHIMDNASSDVKKEYYSLCIDLFKITKDYISLREYEDKLKDISKINTYSELKTIEENILKKLKVKKDRESFKIEKPVFKAIKKVMPTLNEMNDFYQDITLIYDKFFTIDDFREQVRLSLIKLNEQVSFNDCYIITKDANCFHFKKERLYDKKDCNTEIVDRFHQYDTEIISFNTKQDNLFNPFDNDIIEFNHAVIFPLFSEKAFGAIYFVSDNSQIIEGKWSFEKLHNYAKFYNAVSVMHNEKQRIIYDAQSKIEIFDSKLFYYGYSDLDNFYCNNETKKLLGVNINGPFNSFVSNIHANYYKEFLRNFHGLTLEETYFEQLIVFNNDVKVLAKVTKKNDYKYLFIFEDYTKVESNKEKLITTAFHNPITNLKNNKALGVEIHNYFDMKKFSAVLVNFKDLRKYTYLYEEKFSLDILKYLGEILPEFNLEYDYYHLNFDKIVVLIKDTNDKRALKQIINNMDAYLIERLSLINSRLSPRFTYGTYRSFVDTKEKTLDKLLSILSDSILNVNEHLDDNIGFYDIDIYKQRFVKEQLVTYISEAIDKKNLNILFSQCVNVTDSFIEYYEPKLNLSNYKVDDSLLKEVIKRRNLTTSLEQYLIQRTFHEMSLITEATNFSINVVIHIDEYSLVKKSFVNYLDVISKQFKITKQRVIIKLDKVYEGAVDNIVYLMNQGFQIALCNVDDLSLIKPNYFILNNFKTLNQFNSEYVKSLSKILSNLNVKFVLHNTSKNEEIEHYKNDIKYFMGQVYKNQLTYFDIINIFKQELGI